ncbi:MAG: hypothetical protein ACMG6E_02870 [Candidatus Roizmanbacteria bacterium]
MPNVKYFWIPDTMSTWFEDDKCCFSDYAFPGIIGAIYASSA